jgi:hypothetical protein
MKSRLAIIFEILLLTLFAFATGNAQEPVDLQGSANTQEGPNAQNAEPSSSVARISLMHGDVSTQRGDSSDWTAAVLNQPVLSSDKVSTGVGSRAEVQLDGANVLRLGDNTLTTVATLSQKQIQIQVSRGIVDYTVFNGTEADVEIDTGNVAIHPSQKDGVYRVEVNPDGETQVIVRKGEAEISTPEGSTRLENGRMIVVRGTADQAQYKEDPAPSRDSWDTWNNDRDHAIRDAASWSRTNRNYVGSEDLDTNGRWETVPDYGPVWTPTVAPGWAPYRAGRWVWEPGWGWTWVSYEPWGWAPYHYGRWFMYNSSWVWWPGPVVGYPAYRPIWAPAYVSFFGFGGGFGVGVGFGSFGWLPCGPGDRFYPWYGRYGSRFNSINVVNITNIHNGPGRGFGGFAPLRAGGGFSNVRLAGTDERVRMGVSTVAADRFGTGRQAPGGVTREQFNGGRMMAGNLPVVPSRESLSASNRPAAFSTLQRGAQSQRFFTKTQPSRAPQSFDRQAAQVQQSIQRNGQFKAINTDAGRGTASAGRFGQNSSGAAGASSFPRPSAGVRPSLNSETRGGSIAGGQASERGAGSADSQGWRHFGGSNGQSQGGVQNQRSSGGFAAGSRGPQSGNSIRSQSSGNDGSWRHFTPQSGGGMQNSRGPGAQSEGLRGAPEGMRGSPEGMRGASQNSSGGYSRPPLEMRQPIVTPRSSQGMEGPRGGYGGGGAHTQPAGGGGNRGGSGGGGGPHSGGSGHRR